MNRNRTLSPAKPVTTPEPQASQVLRALPFPLPLAADTMGKSMVTLLSAQIGVLYYQWLTIASATGAPLIRGSLTFRMPRGPWFQISRYRVELSTLLSHMQTEQ